MRAGIVIRAATMEDAPHLARVAVAAYSIYLTRLPEGVRPAPMDADYRTAIRQHDVWVATHSGHGQVAGFLILVHHPDHLFLENVAVHPSCQGQGIGHALLKLAQQRAADSGLTTIRLYTHAAMTENQQLYERWGYVETGRRREGQLDRIFYTKEL